MGFPTGVQTRLLEFQGSAHPGVGDDQIISIRAIPKPRRTWRATGWQMPTEGWFVRRRDSASLEVPVTDQSGWATAAGVPWSIVENGRPVTEYLVTVQIHYNGVLIHEVSGGVTVPAGNGSPIDLDTMLPVTTVAGGVVLVPDTWSERLDALEAGGGGGGGALTPVASNTTTAAGATAGALAGYLNTAESAITVNGETVDAGGWVVFLWSGTAWVAVSASTAPVITPPAPDDVTAPVWGSPATATLGTVADTSVQVTLGALATDAVDGADVAYEVSLDGGTTWAVATRSSLTLTLTGLTSGATYSPPKVRAKDAAGNISTVLTAASGFTTTAPAPALTTASLALDPAKYFPGDTTAEYGSSGYNQGTTPLGTLGAHNGPAQCGFASSWIAANVELSRSAVYLTDLDTEVEASSWGVSAAIAITGNALGTTGWNTAKLVTAGSTRLMLGTSDGITFSAYIEGTGGSFATIVAATLMDGQPHFYTLVRTTTSAALYIDGALMGSATFAANQLGSGGLGIGDAKVTIRASGLSFHKSEITLAQHQALAQAAGIIE